MLLPWEPLLDLGFWEVFSWLRPWVPRRDWSLPLAGVAVVACLLFQALVVVDLARHRFSSHPHRSLRLMLVVLAPLALPEAWANGCLASDP